MQRHQKRISMVAAVVLTTMLTAPVRGEVEVIEAYAVTSGGGLTRDSLSDSNLTQTKPTRTARHSTAHRRRARTDPKDFVASRSHRHIHEARQKQSRVAGTTTPPMPKRRNPVVSFVYWWNGMVIRTFHTKVGTVLLGTIGAKS